MQLTLPPEIQTLIDQRVQSGRYQSPEAVVVAAMTSLDQQERLATLELGELAGAFSGIHEKIAQGFAEAQAGRFTDGEAFFDELDREETNTDKA